MTLHYQVEWSCMACSAAGVQETTGYDWDPSAILDGAIRDHAAVSPDCDKLHGHSKLFVKAPKLVNSEPQS